MTVEQGMEFFEDIPAIADRLKTLNDVGLGYLELGQSATTLSGGEAQRVKIASELYRPLTTKTMYLLDEPTVGLHYDDVQKLR
jgi:excinuclease ABC subunit A